ncbi:MAG TPA: SBBP repeat-containing protein [bacterium]
MNNLNFALLIALGFLSFALPPPQAAHSQQVWEEWQARNGSRGYLDDNAEVVQVDTAENVFIAGTSAMPRNACDYAIIKYNPHGRLLWYRTYNGPGNYYDNVSDMALDHAGNAIVTGFSYGSGSAWDYATVKYSASGDQLWVSRYDGPDHWQDYARAIAVDLNNNAYVAGSIASGGHLQWCTIKYSPNGAQQWIATYNGSAGLGAHANDIAADNFGNVYVTGHQQMPFGPAPWDWATIKYNCEGVVQWTASYNGPGDEYDEGIAVAVGYDGSVFVTGRADCGEPLEDYSTIKYSQDGDQLWVAAYGAPGYSEDYPVDIAVSPAGNVFVTGYSGVFPNYDYVTIKYSSAGQQLWMDVYNGPGNSYDEAYDLVLDKFDNCYVTGITTNATGNGDYATIKYNAYGVRQWIALYDGPARSGDGAKSIALDGEYHVYVTGSSAVSHTGVTDYVTIKYSQSGAVESPQSSAETVCLSATPNPFNPSTVLSFEMRDASFVKLSVLDISGRLAATLVDGWREAGVHEEIFDGTGLATGIYIYRVEAGTQSETGKLILLK